MKGEKRMNIEETLKNYLEKKSRIMVLEIRIDKAKKELELANVKYKENENDTIEALQMSAVTINPDKPAATNKFSSATENAAMFYHQESVYKNDFEIMTIKKDIKKWQNEIDELSREVKEIDIALKSLTKEEEFIIQCFYFERMFWRNIENTYEFNFKLFKDERTLRDIRKTAIEKLKRVVA
jgi:hypothetical protein